MTDVVVIAAQADQDAAQTLAATLGEAGLSVSVRSAAGPPPPKSQFVLFCVTQAALKDAPLIGMVWREAPMAEDPTGRFLFAVFDAAAAAHDNFAPFLKRHFHAPGDNAGPFAAHIHKHENALAEAAAAAEERIAQMMRDAAQRPPSAERSGAGAGDVGAAEDRPVRIGGGGQPMGVGSGGRPEGIGAAASPRSVPRQMDIDPAKLDQIRERHARIDAEEDARRAATRAAREEPAAAAAPMPAPAPAAQAQSGVRYSARAKAPPGKLDKVDARAFAPKKLRRGTSELVRVAIFQPRDKGRITREAKQADARTSDAGVAQHLGTIARGAMIAAVIDARGANVEETRIEAEWSGAPLDFNFIVTPHDDAAQALITIRILADDAQVGSIVFARPLAKAKKDGASSRLDSEEKLRRVQRAFLSYSSNDRETVALIASAYERAGIPCFFDRSALASGEEWSPRLIREIERADLFHLCWSRQAAASTWVHKETEHAMVRRRKAKKPEITIQMLDGPPWAPHPADLDALNFDDYARAAVVGYARGEGS